MVRVDGSGSSASLVHVRGLDKTYARGGEVIHVLKGLNLDIDSGDFVAFMGPSGSGKTTLLNLLGDDDPAVYHTIRDRILSCGPPAAEGPQSLRSRRRVGAS